MWILWLSVRVTHTLSSHEHYLHRARRTVISSTPLVGPSGRGIISCFAGSGGGGSCEIVGGAEIGESPWLAVGDASLGSAFAFSSLATGPCSLAGVACFLISLASVSASVS